MLNTILELINILGWLGIVLVFLVTINTGASVFHNMSEKQEPFKIKKLFKGLGKALAFYVSASALAVVVTILPFINNMILETYEIVLVDSDILHTLSGIGVIGVIITVIVNEAKKSYGAIVKLSDIDSSISEETEEIDWVVIDPETEE
jgi:cytochrome bd-type quinol oxidase subunit 2